MTSSTPESEPKSISPEVAESAAPDSPAFGWTTYAERINGRFAMVGFVALLLVELVTHQTFLTWLGF